MQLCIYNKLTKLFGQKVKVFTKAGGIFVATKDNFFQTSDGLWLYYEVTGEGRPIVLIPGFGEALTM